LAGSHPVIPLAQLVEALNGGRSIPRQAVVVSFDDGYVDNYDHALPILTKYRIPATFFIVTGFLDGTLDLIGKNRWRAMTWENAAEIGRTPGMNLGAHGKTHRKLSRLQGDDLVDEIVGSRSRIEDATGIRPALFAYPDGQGSDISPAAKRICEDSGYAGACSTFWSTRHSRNQLFLLSRVMISSRDRIADLRMKVAGAYDYLYFVHKAKALKAAAFDKVGVWR
jgi:peptidoglycan/xylan/chitin deacetylase (PgdA/CDA1 family)